MEADVGEPLVADMLERSDDSVEEGLGADEAVVGKQVGAEGEMLARAEADLEMERPRVAEQASEVDRPLVRHARPPAAAARAKPACPPRSLWPERRP